MTVPGETIADGAAPRCGECGRMPKLNVYLSGAGYYIGTYCSRNCDRQSYRLAALMPVVVCRRSPTASTARSFPSPFFS